MPLRRDNLWILTDYGVQRDWINANTEESAIWPVLSTENIFQRAFVCERIGVVECAIVSLMKTWQPGISLETHYAISLKANIRLRFTVTNDFDKLHQLFPDNYEIADVNASLSRLEKCQFAFIVAAPFCTVRLDDGQHAIFAVDDSMQIVWRAKTVEEDFVQTQRINTPESNTMTLYLRRSIFVFDKQELIVSTSFRNTLRRDLILIFYRLLSIDAIDCIVNHVVANYIISSRDFRNGACEGVFNYSTARLLKVGWLLSESSTCLHEFHLASNEDKKKVYPLLKSMYRKRHAVFDRQPASRRLRSGILY